jgi:hypothetical protein
MAIVLSLSLVIYSYYLSGHINFNAPKLVFKEKPKETKIQAPFTGLMVDPSVVSRKPLAVVIENSPDARPQSGYPQADLVYETLAEGGITRTLAIFQSQGSSEIGPVRSARFYFIDWLTELNAVFVHIGGNADALDEIISKKIPDINQFYYGNYFWRSASRYAPHNVYTTTDKIYDALKVAKISPITELAPLSFKKEAAVAERPATQAITINFSTPLFVASYNYDQKANNYLRSVGGVPHKDKVTGNQLRVKNIVVQYETISPGISRAGEQKMDIVTTGRGRALVFQDGKAINATWEKTSRNSRTKYLDSFGKEVQFNPGQTWFEVVPQNAAVTYK